MDSSASYRSNRVKCSDGTQAAVDIIQRYNIHGGITGITNSESLFIRGETGVGRQPVEWPLVGWDRPGCALHYVWYT